MFAFYSQYSNSTSMNFKKINVFLILIFSLLVSSNAQTQTNGGSTYLMNMAKDMSTDFNDFTNIFFFADKLASFDPQSGVGTIE